MKLSIHAKLLKEIRIFFEENQDYIDTGEIVLLMQNIEKTLNEIHLESIAEKEKYFVEQVEKLYKEYILSEYLENHEFVPHWDTPAWANRPMLSMGLSIEARCNFTSWLTDLLELGATDVRLLGHGADTLELHQQKTLELHKYWCKEILGNEYPDTEDTKWFFSRVHKGPEYFSFFDDWIHDVTKEAAE